jgi:NADH:ubiquinone oxidoreductase subunit 5 (subunit L)/multisubunit Na+/H+ antiporter MnhA subunit
MAMTCSLAAFAGVLQNDPKKVIAYSITHFTTVVRLMSAAGKMAKLA